MKCGPISQLGLVWIWTGAIPSGRNFRLLTNSGEPPILVPGFEPLKGAGIGPMNRTNRTSVFRLSGVKAVPDQPVTRSRGGCYKNW